MVVGETQTGGAQAGAGQVQTPPAAPTAAPALGIDNIMSGIGNTGTVKMNNHRKKLRQRFDIIKKLGQGTYGKVQLGINKETSQEVAIKTIKKCKIETEADLVRIRREVQIMSSVQHPNIIHIYEVFENREKMVLVMEFAAGGELYDYLSERKVLSEDEARRVFRQVATAVYYCHKHKICHRDLKLENILLDENGNAKIADFGLSNVFDDQRLLATFCGSPLYASPEIVKGTPYQGPEVDCWSLGVLLYTLVYGAMPFDGSNFKRLVKQISQGDYYEPKKPSNASPLIREMLTVCPQRRANIEQICSHWWVNEGYPETCLNLAEELANQTPVRLDVLLSLAPSSITADQLVVPNPEETKNSERIVRSHSVGSIVDMANTEAEQRIIDMVQAGGEAALMPSPTRTITPSVDSPAQPKRKLETTMSMDNAIGAKKKERAAELAKNTIAEQMDVVETIEPQLSEPVVEEPTHCEVESIHRGVVELEENMSDAQILGPEENVEVIAESKPQKPVSKAKTGELAEPTTVQPPVPESPIIPPPPRKTSLPEECLNQSPEKRRSRVFETTEKLQNIATQNQEKPTSKFPSPGAVGSVNNFKKEFERRASLTSGAAVPPEPTTEQKEKLPESPRTPAKEETVVPEAAPAASAIVSPVPTPVTPAPVPIQNTDSFLSNDSKSSLQNFSLEEARRSMENSIALLNKARNESNPEMDQLCEKTENVAVSAEQEERQRKLKNAREIIGIRKPPVPFGANGRSISGGVVSSTPHVITKPVRAPEPRIDNSKSDLGSGVKTSRAEIVLKSNTLPRRKPAKTEISLDIKTDPSPQANPMRFSTEMQHQVPDLRSAPIAEHSTAAPFTPAAILAQRATSLEPQAKEHFIPIVRPPSSGVPSQRSSTANTFRSSLSRQSTNDSDTETTTGTTATQSTINVAGANQPIKKSPREFIIPIKMEGGGLITPRAGSLEPSESASTFRSSSTATGGGRPKRLGLLADREDSGDDSLFGRLQQRHTSLLKDNDLDDVQQRFPSLHRLRTTRPIKKVVTEQTESGSSDEENDDEDGFEILTAEKLFSTLLQRVRALTNRVNVTNSSSGTTTAFPSPRMMSTLRQSHSPFWHHDPFAGSSLHQQNYSYRSETVETKVTRLSNNGGPLGATGGSPWSSQMTRDLSSNIDSMFSRSGATLPRGTKFRLESTADPLPKPPNQDLDLRDLDLSQLRLTKRELDTLSSMPIPKRVQDQLLAQLPPNQAKKLSRTLSMQNETQNGSSKGVFKRSLSSGRDSKPDLIKDVCDAAVIHHQQQREQRNSGQLKVENCHDNLQSNSPNGGGNDSGDDQSKSFRSSYSSDTSERFKLLSSSSGNQIPRYYDTLPSRTSSSSSSITTTVVNRPPRSGCLSPPPPLPTDATVRRRSSQRRISRFLRPDFYDTPLEDSIYLDQHPTSDSGRILRDIRERSRERSADRRRDSSSDRLQYLTERYTVKEKHKSCMPDIQNHQINCPQYNPELISNTMENIRNRQRSVSRGRLADESSEKKIQNSDSILNELMTMSGIMSKELERCAGEQSHSNNSQPEGNKSESDMVIKLTNQIDSVSLLGEQQKQKSKKESRLARPKSYPTKELDKSNKSSPDKEEDGTKEPDSANPPSSSISTTTKEETKTKRPKSFQPSKLTPPKDAKKEKTKSPPKSEEATKSKTKKSSKADSATEKQLKDNKSPEKSVKKSFLQTISQKFERLKEGSSKKKQLSDKNNNLIVTTETEQTKSEKKSANNNLEVKTMQETPQIKVDEIVNRDPKQNQQSRIVVTEENENDVSVVVILKKKPSTATQKIESTRPTEPAPQIDLPPPTMTKEKKSKIDDMIRNLRERSVPRGPQMTESNLIKRAVSVEEIPGAYNNRGVNKVLGLFKKIEKDTGQTGESSTLKVTNGVVTNGERPKSSGFVSKIKKTYPYMGAKSDSIVTMTDQQPEMMAPPGKREKSVSRIPLNMKAPCPSCKKEVAEVNQTKEQILQENVQKREIKQSKEEKDRIRNNRKGLMLDLGAPNYTTSAAVILSPNSEASPSALGDTPKEEMITSITSSDSKNSNFDDCGASSSTFLSPMDEPELYFDNWSVCSEDRNRLLMSPTPLMPIPRPRSTTANQDYDPENMLDRIRRKSFYTRFNEKKPKRVSSIVGPGALKDYYNREGSGNLSRSSSRGPELSKSSTGGGLSEGNDGKSDSPTSYRTTSVGRANKSSSSSVIRSSENGNHLPSSNGSGSYGRMATSDYLNNNSHMQHHLYHHHHHHHHHHQNHLPPSTPTSSSLSASRRSGEDLTKKYGESSTKPLIRSPLTSSTSRSNGGLYSSDNRSNSSIYGTYNPKRRISYGNSSQITSPSSIPTISCLDSSLPSAATSSYATLGRKPKSYDQRTVSMLDSSSNALSSTPGLYRRETRSGIDYTNIGRPPSNFRIRTPSMTRPRSPASNI